MTYSTNGAAAVLALEINRNGEVTKKLNPLDREHELTNTLLEGLLPWHRCCHRGCPSGRAFALRTCDGGTSARPARLGRTEVRADRGKRISQEREILCCRSEA